MKRLALGGLVFCAFVLINRVFAHPELNNFVVVFSDMNGGGLTGDFSGWVITNTTATGGQTFTLPPATVGMHFVFSLSAAQYIEIDPQNDDQIIGLTDAAGNKIRSDPATIGSTVELVAVDSTKWLPIRTTIGIWDDMD
jgi:hypothetical protein